MTDEAGDKRAEAEPSWLYRMWWLASTVAVDRVGGKSFVVGIDAAESAPQFVQRPDDCVAVPELMGGFY